MQAKKMKAANAIKTTLVFFLLSVEASKWPTLQAVSDSCDTDLTSFGNNEYSDGPWYPILVYYWAAGSSPVLAGADDTIGFGSCSREYLAEQCGECLYGLDSLPASSADFAVVYSCLEIANEPESQESVWFLARENY